MKRFLRLLFEPLVNFFARYPAVLSGYIIYLYFFLATLDFYRDVKEKAPHHIVDYFQNFDALIWMWLLAWALVKVIEFRSRIQAHEKKELEHRREMELRQTQLNTMQEVVRALQHDINNPLTIILAYLRRAEKAASGSPEVIKNLDEVRAGAERIAKSLADFSRAKAYTTIPSPVGPLAQPLQEDDSERTMDETGASRG